MEPDLSHLSSSASIGDTFIHYYRPHLTSVATKNAKQLPKVKLFIIDELFWGWQKTQKRHLEDGGIYGQIHRPGPKTEIGMKQKPCGPHEERI